MNALGRYVRDRARWQRISLSEVSRRAGVSRQTLYGLSEHQGRLPDLETLIAIAVALEVHPTRLVHLLFEGYQLPRRLELTHSQRGDKSVFVRDITYPDGDIVHVGTRFTKTWEVQNVGTIPWENRFLQCVDDELVVYAKTGELLKITEPLKPVVLRIAVPTTEPGATVRISAEFDAPSIPCTCISYWKSVFEDGSPCFPNSLGLSVKVRVMALKQIDSKLPATLYAKLNASHSTVQRPDVEI
jgi:transcriptional regulator with XRE-family HTH domain